MALDAAKNTKHFWGYVRSKTTVKEKVTRLQMAAGTLTTSDIETADTMNQAINRVFTQENTSNMPTPTGAPLQEELLQVQIHQE